MGWDGVAEGKKRRKAQLQSSHSSDCSQNDASPTTLTRRARLLACTCKDSTLAWLHAPLTVYCSCIFSSIQKSATFHATKSTLVVAATSLASASMFAQDTLRK